MNPRKICIVTGSRAEYGLLYWLMKEIQADTDLQLQVVATGMHLSPEFGLTYRIIEQDGFTLDAKVEMLLSSDTPVGVAKSVGLGVIGFADVYDRLRPDIVVVLGDRFEILAAAQAALFAMIPIAHLHGGETTEGAYDEGIRHAITKMAHWHFVAAEKYRQRVIQMGESPKRVFKVGAPGLDHLSRIDWLAREALERDLGISLSAPVFLVTYHPVTLGVTDSEQVIEQLLEALGEFPDASIVFTYPNADNGGRVIIRAIDAFVGENPARRVAAVSLGQQRYLSLMRLADIVIGNSSSGLTEAPALKKAVVNIGDRQRGRLKAASIIDAGEDAESIAIAIRQGLSADFRAQLDATESLYEFGDASRKIMNLLKAPLPDLKKSFHDVIAEDNKPSTPGA